MEQRRLPRRRRRAASAFRRPRHPGRDRRRERPARQRAALPAVDGRQLRHGDGARPQSRPHLCLAGEPEAVRLRARGADRPAHRPSRPTPTTRRGSKKVCTNCSTAPSKSSTWLSDGAIATATGSGRRPATAPCVTPRPAKSPASSPRRATSAPARRWKRNWRGPTSAWRRWRRRTASPASPTAAPSTTPCQRSRSAPAAARPRPASS